MVGLFFFVFHAVFVFGLVDVEPDLAHAVFIADLFYGCFDDDVVFVYCNIFHIFEGDAEHFIAGHAEELELLGSDIEFSEVDSLEWHDWLYWIELLLVDFFL